MQEILGDYPNLTIEAGAVEDMIIDRSGDKPQVTGIVTAEGKTITAGAGHPDYWDVSARPDPYW